MLLQLSEDEDENAALTPIVEVFRTGSLLESDELAHELNVAGFRRGSEMNSFKVAWDNCCRDGIRCREFGFLNIV